jgi:hypothetical protein
VLEQNLPGVDLSPNFGGYFDRKTQTFSAQRPKATTPFQVSGSDASMIDPIQSHSALARTIVTRVIRQMDSEPPPSIDDLVEDTSQLSILIKTTLDTKEEFVETHFNKSVPPSAKFPKNRRAEYWAPRPVILFSYRPDIS